MSSSQGIATRDWAIKVESSPSKPTKPPTAEELGRVTQLIGDALNTNNAERLHNDFTGYYYAWREESKKDRDFAIEREAKGFALHNQFDTKCPAGSITAAYLNAIRNA
jgi:hypothetical protein